MSGHVIPSSSQTPIYSTIPTFDLADIEHLMKDNEIEDDDPFDSLLNQDKTSQQSASNKPDYQPQVESPKTTDPFESTDLALLPTEFPNVSTGFEFLYFPKAFEFPEVLPDFLVKMTCVPNCFISLDALYPKHTLIRNDNNAPPPSHPLEFPIIPTPQDLVYHLGSRISSPLAEVKETPVINHNSLNNTSLHFVHYNKNDHYTEEYVIETQAEFQEKMVRYAGKKGWIYKETKKGIQLKSPMYKYLAQLADVSPQTIQKIYLGCKGNTSEKLPLSKKCIQIMIFLKPFLDA